MKHPKTKKEKREFVETLLAETFELVRCGKFGRTGLAPGPEGHTLSDHIFERIQRSGLEEGGLDND